MQRSKQQYHTYLDSKDWKHRRRDIRKRAHGNCERCHLGNADDVHHLTYERIGHEYPSDLLVVCRECHEYLHNIQPIDPAAIKFTAGEVKDIRLILDGLELIVSPGYIAGEIIRNPAMVGQRHCFDEYIIDGSLKLGNRLKRYLIGAAIRQLEDK